MLFLYPILVLTRSAGLFKGPRKVFWIVYIRVGRFVWSQKKYIGTASYMKAPSIMSIMQKKILENIEPPISNTLAKTPPKNRFLEIFSVLATPIFMIFYEISLGRVE